MRPRWRAWRTHAMALQVPGTLSSGRAVVFPPVVGCHADCLTLSIADRQVPRRRHLVQYTERVLQKSIYNPPALRHIAQTATPHRQSTRLYPNKSHCQAAHRRPNQPG
eukprot:229897-Chlamydomonas_euryale.AAC.9